MTLKTKTPKAILNALSLLRGEGYVVVAFTPDEVGGADPEYLEERLTELGWDVIEMLRQGESETLAA